MRNGLSDLAIFGASPFFPEPLHIGRPNVGERDALVGHLDEILESRWLTNSGPKVKEFEKRFGEWSGVNHCIATCNATIGLEIAIRALGMSGEVILPSATFVATAHALEWQGVRPVFCDIDKETHNIDPKAAGRLITPRTTGIIGVHLWGRACNVEALTELAQFNQLKLLFDAAHAVGCTYHGNPIGGFGDAEVVSFHATKVMNTFEGGAILTNDGALAKKMRLMRNFGFDGIDNVVGLGTNGKMSEISAAMGLVSLDGFDGFVDCNRKNYAVYERCLGSVPGVRLIQYDQAERNNFQYIVLEYEAPRGGLSRDQLIDVLWSENVLARRYFYPGCHRMEPYRSLYPQSGETLPVTERFLDRVICLPTGTAVKTTDIEGVCSIIEYCVEHSQDIAKRLAGT